MHYDLSNDIGVVQVEQWESAGLSQLYDGRYLLRLKKMPITVRNFGNNTVHEFYVRSENSVKFKVANADLQPGEDTVIILPEAKMIFTQYKPGVEKTLCFWTSHPDYRLDTNRDNDFVCHTFDTPTPAHEVPEDPHLALYPNPAAGNFVTLDGQPRSGDFTLRLVNNLGQEYFKETEQIPATFSIDELPGGYYTVQLLTNRGMVYSGKLVVVR